jgi:glycosyltransferase involved in cell wall biosynthesis
VNLQVFRQPHSTPAISAVIPVRDSSATLAACLKALLSSSTPPSEILVVDDNSSDSSGAIAASLGCIVVTLRRQSFQARARNVGAHMARGEILLFVDSDVVVDPNVIEAATYSLLQHDADAVVVPFSPECPHADFWSQYKHLLVTYNQRSFSHTIRWTNTAFLMIKRSAFDEAFGFDETLPRAICEDFKLGFSLAKNGGKVLLHKGAAVHHDRRFRFRELFDCQVRRSIAFGQILASSLADAFLLQFPVARSVRLSSFALPGILICLAGTRLHQELIWVAAFIGALFSCVNYPLFRYLQQIRGAWFAAASCAVLMLDSAFCCALFAFGFARQLWRARLLPMLVPEQKSA